MTALNPVERGRRPDRRGLLRTHTADGRGRGEAKVLDMMRDVRLPDPERDDRRLSAPALGRAAPAGDDRDGALCEPALLIADEPTTALDVTTQAQILALVRDLMREHGTGVLFITHDFGVVAEIADRVAVLKRGELVELGAAGDVLNAPKHDYTKMLIASVPSMTPRHRAVVDTPLLVETRGLAKTYVQGGWLEGRREVRAAEGVDVSIRQRRDAGDRRRSRAPASRRSRAASRGWIDPDGRPVASTASRSQRCRSDSCGRCGGGFRSCSRTRTGRSTRGARSARRSSKGR